MKANFWKTAIWGGIIAGVVMMMLEMILNPLLLGNSGWAPPRMIAAISAVFPSVTNEP
jgi:hypothetical protein